MKQVKYFILAIAWTLSSCATMVHGRFQMVTINSVPQGADVYINGAKYGQQTPCEVKIKRRVKASEFNNKNEYVYRFEMPDYTPYEYHDRSQIDVIAAFDYLCYGVPGLVDHLAGTDRKYQENILVRLQKKEVIVQEKIVKQVDTVRVYLENKNNKSYTFRKQSEVDKEIPEETKANPNRFALIIGNEDYASNQEGLNTEINVDYAKNDASAFKLYANHILGIPESNMVFLLDGTSGQMKQAISKMNLIAKNTKGMAELFVYYAGHGMPDEKTNESYIMPVDVNGKIANEGIRLSELYSKLNEYPSQRITLFIDACFSGGGRNQGLLTARGVKVKPKEEILDNKLVVFAACSGDQSSLPLNKEHHGIFTYYLLKKLKESKGQISYEELSNYLIDTVSLQSVLVNNKEQTPQTNFSSKIEKEWRAWKMVE